MKLFKIVVFAALTMVSGVSLQAAVVLSNMGANGLTDTSSASGSDLTTSLLFAAGFTTGSVDQQLDRVSLVVSGTGSKSVRLYSNTGTGVSAVPGSLLSSSVTTTISATKSVQSFDFTGVTLTANTKYWVLPDTGMKWFRTVSDLSPTPQNGSGFTFDGMRRSTNNQVSWTSPAQRYTISVSSGDVPPPPPAIPEPALTSLLCFGGIALIRRRMKK